MPRIRTAEPFVLLPPFFLHLLYDAIYPIRGYASVSDRGIIILQTRCERLMQMARYTTVYSARSDYNEINAGDQENIFKLSDVIAPRNASRLKMLSLDETRARARARTYTSIIRTRVRAVKVFARTRAHADNVIYFNDARRFVLQIRVNVAEKGRRRGKNNVSKYLRARARAHGATRMRVYVRSLISR